MLRARCAMQLKPGNEAEYKKRNDEIVKEWWASMADLMETNSDNSPVIYDLQEVSYRE